MSKAIYIHYPGETTTRVITPVDEDNFYYEVAVIGSSGELLDYSAAVGWEEAATKAENYRVQYERRDHENTD